jgi:hypothetical protein
MDCFEQFHFAYPQARREDGQRARAIFAAALRKASLPTLLAAVEQHKRSEHWEIPRYIPLMTVWLLGEHWRQELLEAPATPIAPVPLSPADQAQRWRSLSPQEQLRRLGVK